MVSKLEALDRIRDAEREVQKQRTKAEETRDRILREAKRETLDLREELRRNAEAAYQEVLKAARAETEKEREKILDEGRRRAAALQEAAQAHLEKAAQHLLGRFEEAIHASA